MAAQIVSGPTIVFIGAVSTVFARALLRDIFFGPELRQGCIRLMDIDSDCLQFTERVASRLAQELGVAAEITAATNRREALAGADHVITLFQVGGYNPAMVTDFAIQECFGLQQTI